jgi:hypothetical protein
MNLFQMAAAKIAEIKNPLVIGGGSLGGIEVAEMIPQEGVKLILQAVVAVATLIKFFKQRRDAKKQQQ